MKKIFTTLSITFIAASQLSSQSQFRRGTLTNYVSLQTIKTLPTVIEKTTTTETPKRKCGNTTVDAKYEEAFQKMILKHQQFTNGKKASIVYNIPIIFHVIHTGQAIGTGYNLSLTQINSQITRLNADYRKLNSDFSTYVTQSGLSSVAADCEITFCAAKVSPTGAVLAEPGVDRILASSKGWTSPPYTASSSYLENTVKAGSSWDPTKYFNVWVTEMGGGILGYAQFPTVPSGTTPITDMVGQGGAANTDGVVINYSNLGVSGSANAPYNMGRTLTHESGHWLGLWHIWGDDFGSCSGSDYTTDTPNQDSENYTCPTTNGAVVTDGCTASSPGVNYQNYMDYSDDKCMVMFTAGQKARIQAVMANCVRRASLNTSTVCTVPNGIDEQVSNIEMTIFPNPTNGELNITIDLLNTQDFTISVINTLGQTVKEVKQTQSNGGTVKIDLSSNSAGVYFVTLKSKTLSKTKRIILQ
jgi:hypothetical protein